MNTIIILAERLDNGANSVLAGQLEHCFDGNIFLDGSGVEFLGARCLELLISTSKFVSSHSRQFQITDPSQRFLDDLTDFGLRLDQLVHQGA